MFSLPLLLHTLLFTQACLALLHEGPLPKFPFHRKASSLRLSRSASQRTRNLRTRGAIGIQPISFAQQSYNLIVSVGQVHLRVALDTGSADAWVISSSCTTCGNLPSYPSNFPSPSFVAVNDNLTEFSVEYQDGSAATGFVARETIQIENFTVSNQPFALVNETTLAFGQGQDGISGVFGLGFTRLSSIANLTKNATSLMETLVGEGQLQYPLFGISLLQNDSTLTLGAIDSSVVTNASAVEWHDVVPFPELGSDNSSSIYLHWVIQLSSLKVDNTTIKLAPTYPVVGRKPLVLLDVGTDGIFGPYSTVSAIFAQMNGSRLVSEGQWAVPCDIQSQLNISFGGQSFILKPADYIIGEAQGTPGLCLAWPAALPPSPDGIDWQFGIAWLRGVYTIFSFGINGKEPPLVGLYSPTTGPPLADSSDNGTSSITFSTIPTTLPNVVLPTPTFSTPKYLFNTSVTPLPTPGQKVQSGLGATSYIPILVPLNVSAIPSTRISSTVVTTTNSAGIVTTTTTNPPPMVPLLGMPPAVSSQGARITGRCGLGAFFLLLSLHLAIQGLV